MPTVGSLLEHRLGHLRAAGLTQTDEQDVRHRLLLGLVVGRPGQMLAADELIDESVSRRPQDRS